MAASGLALITGCAATDSVTSEASPRTSSAPATVPPATSGVAGTPFDGVVTQEQSERKGRDGEAECQAPVVTAFVTDASAAPPRLQAGFLSDPAGLRGWNAEFLGNAPASAMAQAVTGDFSGALCFFEGDFTLTDTSFADPVRTARYLVLGVAPEDGGGIRVIAQSAKPIGIVAPPGQQNAGTLRPEQPAGVEVRG